MLHAELPQPLQEEFERTAQLLHDTNGIQYALIEAVELWLAQQHQKLVDSVISSNNQVFEELRSELEAKYSGQWIVIAEGKFLGAADTPEELNHLAPTARHRILIQMGNAYSNKVELGWQMNFA